MGQSEGGSTLRALRTGFRAEVRDRKRVESIIESAAASRTGATLTTRHLVPLGVAVVIGSGAYNRIGESLVSNGVPATTLGLLLATVACLGAAACFAELASTVPVGGSAFTYSYAAFGKFTAWTVGWLLVLQYAPGAGVVAFDWAGFVTGSHGQPLACDPPDQIVGTPFRDLAVGAVLVVGITAVLFAVDRRPAGKTGAGGERKDGKRDPRRSAVLGVLAASVVTKVAALVAAVVAGVWILLRNGPDAVGCPPPPDAGLTGAHVLGAAGLLYFAYIGFDAVGTAAEDARYPPRDLPRAILTTLAIAGVVYFAMVGVSYLAYAYAAGDPLYRFAGSSLPGYLFRAGAFFGLPSGVAVLVYALSRVLAAMRRDGLFRFGPLPGWTGREASSPGSRLRRWVRDGRPEGPVVGFLVLAGLVVTALVSDSPTAKNAITEITNLATASAFAIVAVGTVALRYRRPDLPRTFRTPLLPLVSVVTVGASLALFWNAYTTPALLGWLLWVVAGLVLQLVLILGRIRPWRRAWTDGV